jgi:hypothetical protein
MHRKRERMWRQAQAHVMRRLEVRFGKIHHEVKPSRCYVPQGVVLGELPIASDPLDWNGASRRWIGGLL